MICRNCKTHMTLNGNKWVHAPLGTWDSKQSTECHNPEPELNLGDI